MTITTQDNFVINYNSTGVRGFSPVGYRAPADLIHDEWMHAGVTIRTLDRFKNFAIGDWILAGERKFGEMYAQAIDEFEWGTYSKITKLVWVARNVPYENRRADLTWMHHHNVSSLPTKEQMLWLAYAADERLTADELKDAIKQAHAPISAPTADAIDRDLAGDDEPPYADDKQYDCTLPDAYDMDAFIAIPREPVAAARMLLREFDAGQIAELVAELVR